MTSPSSQTFTTVVTDDTWMRGLHPGHLVELVIYGQAMVGKVARIAHDNITVTIPIEEQTGDVRRFSVTGTAVLSIDGAAARVPVSAQATGEFVRLQIIGPAEIVQRRMHVRVPLSVPVHLAWLTEKGSGDAWSWAESRTMDISVGGLRVAAARVVWPSVGDTMRLSIDLPQGRVVEEAVVIGKTADYDLRLEFTGIGPVTRVMIEQLVQGTPPAPAPWSVPGQPSGPPVPAPRQA